MQIDKQRIRIDYAPLNVAVSTVLMTPNSPLTQVYNGFTDEHDPDRELTPTVILPQVVAAAADGSWGDPYSNQFLADMKWYANGKDITTLTEWTDKYVINETVTSMRGALTIKKNLMPGESVALHFEGVLVDNRLGTRIPIATEPVTLSTSDKSQNMYSIGIGDDQIIQYDPFKDKLFLYDFKVSHGLLPASSAAQAAATDENAYIREIPVTVYKGNEPMTTDYSLKLYRITGTSSPVLTEMKAGTDELIGITATKITLDLRLVQKENYLIKAISENREVAQIQFSVSRLNPSFSVRYKNGTAINPGDTQRYNEVMVDTDGNVVECPGSIIKFDWYTDTEAKKGVQHNEGDVTLFLLSKTGIGNSYNDSWLATYVTAEPKEAHKVATDASGNIYTDASGNPYIFN